MIRGQESRELIKLHDRDSNTSRRGAFSFTKKRPIRLVIYILIIM